MWRIHNLRLSFFYGHCGRLWSDWNRWRRVVEHFFLRISNRWVDWLSFLYKVGWDEPHKWAITTLPPGLDYGEKNKKKKKKGKKLIKRGIKKMCNSVSKKYPHTGTHCRGCHGIGGQATVSTLFSALIWRKAWECEIEERLTTRYY